MALAPGLRLGVYAITAQIGEGGMGRVYRATDTTLGRQVAIKILPDALASDPERLARFEREAKTLASLNHPHIAAIYAVEKSAGLHALVMELVEGDDLSQRIARGAIPLDEALAIATQIADALEAAHEQGIIHRDLKPANIKMRADGTVKVLDFGLAKILEPGGAGTGAAGTEHLTQSPTITSPAMITSAGMILGTAAYMSPEQARGKFVDKRADIWAFGCVLWEMLTGARLFQGATISDTLAAVLKTEPDWHALAPTTPAAIRRLLRRCLEKDRKRRLDSAAAARLEIDDALGSPWSPDTFAAPLDVSTARWWRGVPWTAAVVAASSLAGVAAWTLKPAPPRPVSRLTITLPPGDQLAGLDLPVLALSADGSHLVYVATRGGHVQQLYLRAMDNVDAKPIPDTQGATTPFFSPDGQWVGFFAGGRLKKIALSGGKALTLGDANSPRGASWSRGVIVFGPTNSSGLLQVSEGGGTSDSLAHAEQGAAPQKWPELLPGGNAVLFSSMGRVGVQVLATGERRDLALLGTSPRYVPSGHLVYADKGSLMAVPFDRQRLELTGAPVLLVEGVLQTLPATGDAQYSVSAAGTLAYVAGGLQEGLHRLVWVTRAGTEEVLPAPARDYGRPRISPDGRWIAVGADGHIRLYDFAREQLTQFTFDGTSNNFPIWTPDGKRIVFNSNRDGPLNLFWKPADGSGEPRRLAASPYTQAAHSWSRNGQLLTFSEINATTGYDIWALRLGDAKAHPILNTSAMEGASQLSPDGHWLAYVSDVTGQSEIYVQAYPGPGGGKLQVSADGGTEPMWNPNGRELFYRSHTKMMAVDIATQSGLSASKPQALFEGPYQPSPYLQTNYDVSADGQRFLMLKPVADAQTATQITVVLNWQEELKRLVPTR